MRIVRVGNVGLGVFFDGDHEITGVDASSMGFKRQSGYVKATLSNVEVIPIYDYAAGANS